VAIGSLGHPRCCEETTSRRGPFSARDVVPWPSMAAAGWCLPRRVAFRFTFVYLGLYELPFLLKRPLPADARPLVERVASFEGVVRYFGHHVLGVAGELPMDLGGGDSLFQWVRVAFLVAVASMATLIWSALDRGRAEYGALFDALRTYVRYGLAFAMLFYGVVKVFPIQFAPPWLNKLLET